MCWPERPIIALCLALAAGGCARPSPERFLAPSRGTWKRISPVRRYAAENLHQYIDGEAPFVVSFGFRSLHQAAYRCKGGSETTVDLYDMGSAANAFALFRSKANVESAPLDVGSEGAGEDATVEFWQGGYFVALGNPSPEEHASVVALARDLAKALPPTEAWPAYLELLPTTGRVERSEGYLPADFFGHEFLKRAVSARYKLAGRETLLFACRYDRAKEAAQALVRFREGLARKQPARPLKRADGGFIVDDAILGRLAVFRRGRFLGGLTRYLDDPAFEILLDDLDGRLRSH